MSDTQVKVVGNEFGQMVQEPSKEQAQVVGQEVIKLFGGAKNEKSSLKPEPMQM